MKSSFCLYLVYRMIDQLPLDPPVLIGFLLAPDDLVLAFAINFELPPACTLVFALEAVFLSATFLLIANPIYVVLDPKLRVFVYLRTNS
jgi:hypothetical protein